MTPKDFFLYIGAMITLYISVFSLIALLFQYVEFLLPDRLQYFIDPYASGVRWQMALLIIIFPAYLVLTRLLNRDIRAHSDKKHLGIRRWLIYLTLFVAGATVLGDLIVLLNTFLGGELTLRFVLKVLTVFAVVGAVFLYYFLDLKGRWEQEPKNARMIAWVAGLLVLASIIAGFFIMGSPQTQRLLRFDQQKVSDLQSIQWQIVNYWQQKEILPETLSQLEDPISGFIVPTDRQDDSAYGYTVTDELSFELCAVFNREGQDGQKYRAVQPRVVEVPEKSIGIEIGSSTWAHEAGETCFKRTIDPELYQKRTL